MERKYPDRPIIGVGGIVFEGDRVLLVKRAHDPGKGQWSIPGGVVRVGETLKEAVVREVLEETHLKVEVLALVKVLDRIFRDGSGRVAYHYILVDFLCEGGDGQLRADSDAEEARFSQIEELAPLKLAPITEEVIRRAHWMRNHPQTWTSMQGAGDYYS